VVSGSANVEASTRARVQQAIEDTGYKPNINARSLRSRSGQLVGLAVPQIVNEAFAHFIHFAEQEAHRMGYGLVIGNTEDDPEREQKFIDDLLSRNVDAIIFSRVSDASRLPMKARERNLPLVVIDRGIDDEDIPSIELDNVEAGAIVARLFARGGHHRVAMVAGPENVRLARERSAGFTKAAAAAGLTLQEPYVYEGSFEFETGVAAADHFLSLAERPTAVWAQCDLAAVGLMHRFVEHGLTVPDDISVVGMDNVAIARMVYPPLTTVMQPFEEFCSRAFSIIHRQLEDPSYRPEANPVVVRPSMVLRESYRNLN
jgi:DNA-binding LacI/PurR family transcriptional regulator